MIHKWPFVASNNRTLATIGWPWKVFYESSNSWLRSIVACDEWSFVNNCRFTYLRYRNNRTISRAPLSDLPSNSLPRHVILLKNTSVYRMHFEQNAQSKHCMRDCICMLSITPSNVLVQFSLVIRRKRRILSEPRLYLKLFYEKIHIFCPLTQLGGGGGGIVLLIQVHRVLWKISSKRSAIYVATYAW